MGCKFPVFNHQHKLGHFPLRKKSNNNPRFIITSNENNTDKTGHKQRVCSGIKSMRPLTLVIDWPTHIVHPSRLHLSICLFVAPTSPARLSLNDVLRSALISCRILNCSMNAYSVFVLHPACVAQARGHFKSVHECMQCPRGDGRSSPTPSGGRAAVCTGCGAGVCAL